MDSHNFHGGRYRLLALLSALVVVAALVAVGVGAANAARPATVKAHASPFGRILVDAQGRALYLFEKDKNGRSACNGQCAAFWPPLLTKGKPTAGVGAKASLLGATRRSDGTMQVTYARHPLYRYAGDAKPGQVNGEGLNDFGAGWDVLAPGGKKIEKD